MGRIVRRAFVLMLVAALVYLPPGGWWVWFQTLTHIAFTTLWVLPVLRLSMRTQAIFLVCSSLLHVGLSAWFWQDWLLAHRVIDGEPLGLLTWTIPTLLGVGEGGDVSTDGAVEAGADAGWLCFVVFDGRGGMGGTAIGERCRNGRRARVTCISQRDSACLFIGFLCGVTFGCRFSDVRDERVGGLHPSGVDRSFAVPRGDLGSSSRPCIEGLVFAPIMVGIA